MRLDKIKIKNFRCFESMEISFGSKATILIGKNGSGKSSLISALKSGLSFLFAKTKDNDFKYNLCTSNDSEIRPFGFWDARFDEIERAFNYPVSIWIQGGFANKALNWEFLKESPKGKLKPNLYKHAQHTILADYNDAVRKSKLPLLAFYSDSFPHVLSEASRNAKQLVSRDVIPRDFGYHGWDETANCTDLWLIRYKKTSKFIRDYQTEKERIEAFIKQYTERGLASQEESINVLKNRLEAIQNDKKYISFQNETEFVSDKIFKITAPLRRESVRINDDFQVLMLLSNSPAEDAQESVEFVFSDGRSIFFEMLPQGYKRIFSIALDLAYRSYILNKTTEFEGVVFIDEIDLHLHPSLQQEIMERFQRAFPSLQFIVTTHSPLVVSNLNADGAQNKIVRLENEAGKYSSKQLENVFGIDYATNLAEVMGVPPRSSTIDKYINGYLFLIGKKKKEDAEKMLDKLRGYLGGEIPPLLMKEINDQEKAYL